MYSATCKSKMDIDILKLELDKKKKETNLMKVGNIRNRTKI